MIVIFGQNDSSVRTCACLLLVSFMMVFFVLQFSSALCRSAFHKNWMPSKANCGIELSTKPRRPLMSLAMSIISAPQVWQCFFIVACISNKRSCNQSSILPFAMTGTRKGTLAGCTTLAGYRVSVLRPIILSVAVSVSLCVFANHHTLYH